MGGKGGIGNHRSKEGRNGEPWKCGMGNHGSEEEMNG